MLGRPAPLLILAVLGAIGGLLCVIVAMQFAEVIPWAGHEATHIGGRWTGVVSYTLAAAFFFGSAFAWITVKRWAHMISILAAIIGFFVPFISYMDDTDLRSSAMAPIVVSMLMLFMVFRPSTNRAMSAALSGQGTGQTKKAAPAKPMSAARKRELAKEEQNKAKSQAAAPAPVAVAAAPEVATSPVNPVMPAVTAVAPAAATAAKSAAAMVFSAASTLKSAAATPASPRKGVASAVGGTTSRVTGAPILAPGPEQTAASAPSKPAAQRVPALRADEV